jgi:YVTN family beta-propeller protein
MKRTSILIVLLAATALVGVRYACAGQAPGAANAPDIAINHKDRFYTSDQFSNTVSVIDPMDNKLVGVLRLGDTTPANLSPLYKGQLLVHGMGFSPDHRTLAVVSIGSNSVTFIDTATNAIKHVTYVGRSPHGRFLRQTARKCGLRCAVRVTLPRSMDRRLKKGRVSGFRRARA